MGRTVSDGSTITGCAIGSRLDVLEAVARVNRDKNAHIFRLRCKIPIINLSEPARGPAMVVAVDDPEQNDPGTTRPRAYWPF
jgi:hypothetical protein